MSPGGPRECVGHTQTGAPSQFMKHYTHAMHVAHTPCIAASCVPGAQFNTAGAPYPQTPQMQRSRSSSCPPQLQPPVSDLLVAQTVGQNGGGQSQINSPEMREARARAISSSGLFPNVPQDRQIEASVLCILQSAMSSVVVWKVSGHHRVTPTYILALLVCQLPLHHNAMQVNATDSSSSSGMSAPIRMPPPVPKTLFQLPARHHGQEPPPCQRRQPAPPQGPPPVLQQQEPPPPAPAAAAAPPPVLQQQRSPPPQPPQGPPPGWVPPQDQGQQQQSPVPPILIKEAPPVWKEPPPIKQPAPPRPQQPGANVEQPGANVALQPMAVPLRSPPPPPEAQTREQAGPLPSRPPAAPPKTSAHAQAAAAALRPAGPPPKLMSGTPSPSRVPTEMNQITDAPFHPPGRNWNAWTPPLPGDQPPPDDPWPPVVPRGGALPKFCGYSVLEQTMTAVRGLANMDIMQTEQLNSMYNLDRQMTLTMQAVVRMQQQTLTTGQSLNDRSAYVVCACIKTVKLCYRRRSSPGLRVRTIALLCM